MTTPTAAPVHESGEGYTHKQILVIMSGLMLGMFLAALDQTIVSTALPTIVGDFHRTDLLSWVITAYLLTSTAATPLWGKAGDLYGRKRVFQLAIVVFLVGSVLCGAAQNMYQLIAFRGIQGIGGGGLISLVFAIIGDVIPPRERGRYQGYFGGVFGLSSVVGPLAGGFFVDNTSWRYIFYINLPLGILALIVTNRVLKLPFVKREVKIDWAGAGLLVSGVSSILLATQSGGKDYPWGSPQIIGLFALGAAFVVGFVLREKVAPEPILPLRLFRMQFFSVVAVIAFISGVAMFGALAFLPQYLQLVHGQSATASGLMLLPLLVGILGCSIGSGRYISATGNYRWFPVVGTAIVAVGLGLLSHVGAHTSLTVIGLYVFVFGAGLGLFMQVLVIAVQNSVERRDLGVGTSSVTFFRSMGGTIGASAFGAVLINRLGVELPARLAMVPRPELAALRAHGSGRVTDLISSPNALQQIKLGLPHVYEATIQGYSTALDRVFLYAVPVALLGFLVSFAIKQVQLRGSAPGSAGRDAGQAAPSGGALASGEAQLDEPMGAPSH